MPKTETLFGTTFFLLASDDDTIRYLAIPEGTAFEFVDTPKTRSAK